MEFSINALQISCLITVFACYRAITATAAARRMAARIREMERDARHNESYTTELRITNATLRATQK